MNHKLLTVFIAVGVTTSSSAQQPRKAMSIDNFDYSAVLSSIQAIWGTDVNLGVGINAMMTKRIQQDGRFVVVERRKVKSLMAEQDFANSSRVKRGTGARTGEIRGADLTLMGDIVVFGRDDKQERRAGGKSVLGIGGASASYRDENKAVVVLNYRLVDTETSETVAAGEARGESKRVSEGKGSAFYGGLFGSGKSVSLNSSNFAETIIGEAVMDSVDKLAIHLRTVNLTAGTAGRAADVDARIADVSGNTLIINAGSSAGILVGQTFTVYHKGKEVKDPSTGEVLDLQTTVIGKLTITNVRDRVSTGSYNGSTAPVVGDVVRP